MRIELKQDELEAVIRDALADGVRQGVSDWKIRQEIADQATEAVKEVDLPALIGKRMSEELPGIIPDVVEGVTTQLGELMKEAMREAAISTAVNITYALRRGNVDGYLSSTDEEKMKREIRKEMRAKIEEAK